MTTRSRPKADRKWKRPKKCVATGLHRAAYEGHTDTVRILLKRGAPVDAKDESFDGTPLRWTLYAWGNSPTTLRRGHYYKVGALLVRGKTAAMTPPSARSPDNSIRT